MGGGAQLRLGGWLPRRKRGNWTRQSITSIRTDFRWFTGLDYWEVDTPTGNFVVGQYFVIRGYKVRYFVSVLELSESSNLNHNDQDL